MAISPRIRVTNALNHLYVDGAQLDVYQLPMPIPQMPDVEADEDATLHAIERLEYPGKIAPGADM
jgi:hypothetical protein